MTASLLHPALPLLAGAALTAFFGKKAGGVVSLAAALTALWAVSLLPADGAASLTLSAAGVTLDLLRADRLATFFAWIFALCTVLGCLYGFGRQSGVERAAALTYAGAALGAVFAGDMVTLYVFWEVMALSAVFVILAGKTAAARGAAFRYAMAHLFGGVCLLAGLALIAAKTGQTAFSAALFADGGPGALLVLAGFLINASAFPFSAWLPDSYPESSQTGGVFLSAFTTKTAVYVLIRAFPGLDALIVAGVLMILYGLVYALRENDLRRLLSYSITNQVGFMLIGIGVGTPEALNGTCALAFCHILYKSLLFMSAGSVITATGKRRLTELGGLASAMPVTCAATIVGAMSLSALPGTCGFISKPMLLFATAESHRALLWLFLEAASAGTLLYAGLAVPYFVFFGKAGAGDPAPAKNARQAPPAPREASFPACAAMILTALACLGIGLHPAPLYALSPFAAPAFTPFEPGRIAAILELSAFAGLFFVLYLPVLRRRPGITLDTDWIYRTGGRRFYRATDMATSAVNNGAARLAGRVAAALGDLTRRGPQTLAALAVSLLAPILGQNARALRDEAAQAARTWTVPVGVPLACALAGLCLLVALVL
jgi:multicomponent Na+:H+ antiporter subunit D